MGTKICYGAKQATSANTTQNFPISFKGTPRVIVQIYDPDGGSWYAPCNTAVSVTSFTTNHGQHSYKPYFQYVAVGR